MSRFDRLREYAKSLRAAPPGETTAQRREREGLRYEAERRLREHDRAMMKWDVLEDPRVRKMRDGQRARAVVEAEDRARLRREVPEPPPTNPALLALARSDSDRVHEQAWRDTDGTPIEGWIGADS